MWSNGPLPQVDGRMTYSMPSEADIGLQSSYIGYLAYMFLVQQMVLKFCWNFKNSLKFETLHSHLPSKNLNWR
jgi:hypothetical protein